MRYSVHLMFGRESKKYTVELKKYIQKYGGAGVSPYFNTLWWDTSDAQQTVVSSAEFVEESENDPFISGLQNLYRIELTEKKRFPAKERNFYIEAFFKDLFNETITINNMGDYNGLHLVLYVPLFDNEIYKEAKELIKIIQSLPVSYHIDMLAFAPDMAFLFTKEEDIAGLALKNKTHENDFQKNLNDFIAFNQKEGNPVTNFILLQNCQKEGISLNLNFDSFIRLTGEFALLSVEQYENIFVSRTDTNSIKTLGLSILHFDRFYFVHYLLRQTYLYIMDKENINIPKVDITKADQIAHNKLESKIHLISDFYEKEVKPHLHTKSQKQIIVDITPKLDKLVEDLSVDLQSFIFEDKLSLPEKKATLATLLGLDDELLTNYLFDRNQLIIDDLDTEAANIFINANNAILNSKNPEDAILSISGNEAELPVEELKKLRYEMRQATTYIREKEEQLDKLDHQKTIAHEGSKRLTENGFIIEGNRKLRLLPDIEELPLADTYTARETTLTSVDLRSGFTTVKTQGQQGACSAFSLASIYEYILKTNNALDSDLSEAFLYYNARKKSGNENEDSGVSYYDTISALTEFGICLEQTFPYNENVFNKEPDTNAYDEAANYLVKKAMNVNQDINDIRSALAEGYPVAISLKIFESFSNNSGAFISRPSDEDFAKGSLGSHAMVICGYSDEQRFFIVRNSWGTGFGENGYCYIPYSYIGDSSLMNMACIITEVGSGFATNKGNKVTVEFDITDTEIEYSILKNLLEEEKYHLQLLIKKDKKLREKYIALIHKLGNNAQRNILIEGNEKRLQNEIEDAELMKQNAITDKAYRIKMFNRETRRVGINIGIITLSILILLGVLFYFLRFWDVLSLKETWYCIGASAVLAAFAFFYFPYRKKKRRLLKEELDSVILSYAVQADKLREEMKTTRLRMHLAGMLLDRLFNLKNVLKNKYTALRSFSVNLTTWYTEEKDRLEKMNADTREPFIALLDNKTLDTYFENHKDKIASGIKLSDFLNSYEISEEGITRFKKSMKNTIVLSLFDIIKDFKLYNHISGEKEYNYLNKQYSNIPALLNMLDKKSKVFLQLTTEGQIEPLHQVIFIKTDSQKEKNQWQTIYPDSFSLKPVSQGLDSQYKVILFKVQDVELDHIKIMK